MAASAASLTAIQKVYIAYYGRPADPIGLDYWATKLDAANGNLSTIINAFGTSAEATARFAGQTTATMINNLYLQMFNRAAEPAGLSWWVQQVTAGNYTLATVMQAVLAGAQGTDADVIAGKLASADLYTAAMDTTAEILAYQGTTAADAGRAFLTPVGATAVTAAAADTAVATMVTGSVPPPVNQTFTLTTGTDNFTGGAGDDTFNAGDIAGVTSWTVGDAVNGGAGNDSFIVSRTAAITVPVSATVTNVETATLTSGGTVTANTSTWTGLTALNSNSVAGATLTAAATTGVTATDTALAAGAITVDGGLAVGVTGTAQTTGTITVGGVTAAAGAVTVTSSGDYTDGANNTLGAIIVNGGTAVTVKQTTGFTAAEILSAKTDASNFTETLSAVTVTGNASTTSVSVTQDKAVAVVNGGTTGVIGVTNGKVVIADANAASLTAAGTITTVTLGSYGAASTINSSALTTINLSGSNADLTVTQGALTTATVKTQALNLNGVSLSATAGSTGVVTLGAPITTLNLDSSTAASTITSLVAAGVTTLNITGDAKVTLTGQTLGALTSVTVTNTAGASLGTALAAGVLFTGGAGADTVSLGATTKAITMGAGNDVVTSAGLVGSGGSVSAGDGTDTIIMSTAEAAVADNDATFNTKFTGFEVLQLSDALTGGVTLDLAGINGVSSVTLTAGGASTTTSIISNLASGGTIKQTGNGTGAVVLVTNALFSAADVLNFNMSKTTALAAGSLTAAGVETINISTADASTSGSTAAIHSATLVAVDATSIVVTGNNGLTLTNTGNVAVTKFDASGVVANGTADTAASLAVSFTSANTKVGAAITITGGAGNDVLKGNAAVVNSNTITGGEGADTITTGKGNDTIILTETTAAADTVIFVTAANNGVDTINDFAAGAGADIVQLAATTTIGTTGGAAGVFATSTNTTLTNGAQAFALTGASSTTSDVIEINATLSSFGNLAAVGVVDGSELLKGLSSNNVAATALTATTAADNCYFIAYQGGNAYLYQALGNADTAIVAAELSLIGVFNGVAAGAFATGDVTMT